MYSHPFEEAWQADFVASYGARPLCLSWVRLGKQILLLFVVLLVWKTLLSLGQYVRSMGAADHTSF